MDIKRFTLTHYVAAGGLFLFFFYLSVSAPPSDMPVGQIVLVREGAGLLEVSNNLKSAHVIRNAAWFRAVAELTGGEKNLHAGDYYLPYRQSVYTIVRRLRAADYEVSRVKLTIPEGYTAKKIANLFDARFTLFNKHDFLAIAKEGYLFPDTYFVGFNSTATSTVKLLTDTFDKKIFPYTGEIAASGHSLNEIVTMASILELEAQSQADREIVSGILWRRLSLGMPLQVDAALTYINGKESKDMTQGDLEVSSPYNTYVYKGLPPTPIGNPGLESIEAALNPATSTYLYFLTDNQGKMHYAKTFEEHVANKQKYLQ